MRLAAFEIGPIRPPSEAQSLLVRITRNCPWNQCEFCRTYKGEKFSIRPVQEVKNDIDQMKLIADEIHQLSWTLGFAGEMDPYVLRNFLGQEGHQTPAHQSMVTWLYHGGDQVFLQDADSLIIKTPDLIEILGYLRDRFPRIRRITSYARSKTLVRKSLGELKELHQAGLTRIHIGMESGYDPLLQWMKKGVTAREHVQAGRWVLESGISLSEYFMPGLGGQRWSQEHAVESARVLNQIDPDYIRLRSLYIRRDMPLFQKVVEGSFVPLTEDQRIAEIRRFIETLDGIRSTIVSDHILNLLEEVEGRLPGEKQIILDAIDRYLALPEEERRRFRVGRRLGCMRLLDDLQDAGLREQVDNLTRQIRQSIKGDETTLPTQADVEKEIYNRIENYI